jgi:hypothetical protein
MLTKLKCSACGAELDKIALSATKDQWLLGLALSLLVLFPAVSMFWVSSEKDFGKDLQLREVQKKLQASSLTVIGAIHNAGGRRWEHPTIEAEFYSSSGQFLGELAEDVSGYVAARATEHFSVSLKSVPAEFDPDKDRIEIKISDAYSPSR